MQNKEDFALLHPLRVRWAECDAQGIVFNVNYFLFIDVAMTEWLRALGIMGSDTTEFFTVHAEADYRASAKFDDMLDIGVRCVSFGRSSMTLVAGIFRGDQLMTEGKMVYDRIGFMAEYNLARWERTRPATGTPGPPQAIEENDWPSLVKLDAPVFGTDREQWLRLLTQDSSRALLNRKEDGVVNAYGMSRAGERAEYLGPVVADRPTDGEKLIRKLLDGAQQNTVYWDIPDDNKEAVALAEEMGFVRQRPFIRMWLGEANVRSEPEKQWAISDPSTG